MAWASHQPKSEHLEQAQAPTKDMRPERHKALSHLGLEAQAQLGGGFVHEALESFCLNTECNHPQAPTMMLSALNRVLMPCRIWGLAGT